MLNLQTAELYMPILHSRPSNFIEQKIMQRLEVILYASGIVQG